MSARSLRHYEDEGLIVPGRCGNGFRDYCQATIDRVLAIRPLLASGLPVRLIRERLGARIAVLREQQDALDAFL
ncbi:DNA-binding transcriptional MerR regulator [Crossiella equi]|uniref:DNA-binding transcriptional MerR regulator n=2 Tax=Crossiella equi TaxID=130796 RepID=A0ABS5AS70_9PSEU|nr:DNA-binding transcriptional MerR regulator [Crossiella equi]